MSAERLFISHASEDAAIAERIVGYLEARGVPCWISSRDIPPRAIYADAIVEGMQSSSGCAVLISAASNLSKAVKREVELASHEDKAFIPIRIDRSEPAAGLAYYIRNAQWVDYNRDGDRALDRIAALDADAPSRAAVGAPQPRQNGAAVLIIAAIGGGALLGGAWFAWSALGGVQPETIGSVGNFTTESAVTPADEPPVLNPPDEASTVDPIELRDRAKRDEPRAEARTEARSPSIAGSYWRGSFANGQSAGISLR